MKRILILAVFAGMLAACGNIPTLTFQQQVAIVCSNANAAISIASDDGLFTGAAAQTLTVDIQPAIGKACAPGVLVTSTNLQGILDNAVPALKALVSASSLAQQSKNDANTAIDLVTLAVNDAIALVPAATPTAATTVPAAQ